MYKVVTILRWWHICNSFFSHISLISWRTSSSAQKIATFCDLLFHLLLKLPNSMTHFSISHKKLPHSVTHFSISPKNCHILWPTFPSLLKKLPHFVTHFSYTSSEIFRITPPVSFLCLSSLVIFSQSCKTEGYNIYCLQHLLMQLSSSS